MDWNGLGLLWWLIVGILMIVAGFTLVFLIVTFILKLIYESENLGGDTPDRSSSRIIINLVILAILTLLLFGLFNC